MCNRVNVNLIAIENFVVPIYRQNCCLASYLMNHKNHKSSGFSY